MSDETDSPEPDTTRWPPTFADWPLEAQIDHLRITTTRRGLMAEILSHSGLAREQYQLDDDTKLTKKELAAVLLRMEGF